VSTLQNWLKKLPVDTTVVSAIKVSLCDALRSARKTLPGVGQGPRHLRPGVERC
jgi:hypothetical protein